MIARQFRYSPHDAPPIEQRPHDPAARAAVAGSDDHRLLVFFRDHVMMRKMRHLIAHAAVQRGHWAGLSLVRDVMRMRYQTPPPIDSVIHTGKGSGVMDCHLLDQLSKRLAMAPESRRSTLRRLARGVFTTLLLGAAGEQGAAKKRKKCKKGKKKCGRTCITQTACCTDGAPGCPAYSTCTNGQCLCNQGLRQCGSDCIPKAACCTDAECGAVPCIAHTCDCNGRGDGTACGGGRQCSGGECDKAPACTAGFEMCTFDAECCGVQCLPAFGTKLCTCSPAGKPCHSKDCCGGSTCIGFVCQ